MVVDQGRILEREVGVEGADPVIARGDGLVVVGAERAVVQFVATLAVEDRAAFLRVAVDAEGGLELMQEPGMVGVLDVLEIELPVPGMRWRV